MNYNEELNNINNFVIYVKACKEAMRQALIGQEQDVPVNATIESYADYISAIEGGGGVTVYTVTYLDWDGTVLKSQDVLEGGDVLPPSNPERDGYSFVGWDGVSTNVLTDLTITALYAVLSNTVYFLDYDLGLIEAVPVAEGGTPVINPPVHENLIFNGWHRAYDNVQEDIVVIATYKTADDATYAYLSINELTGKSVRFYFFGLFGAISADRNLTIDWGDGIIDSSSFTSNSSFYREHTYIEDGDYVVKMTTNGSIMLGNTNAPNGTVETFLNFPTGAAKALTRVYVGGFNNGVGFRILANTFYNNSSLTDVVYNNATIANSCAYYSVSAIERIIFPVTLTQMDKNTGPLYWNGIHLCANLKQVVFLSETPPTGSGELFSASFSLPADLKVYVPKDSVDAYKARFSYGASRVFPMEELIQLY